MLCTMGNERNSTDVVDGILDVNSHLFNDNSSWKLFGKNIPKSEIVFFSQVIIIYTIILVSIINLSLLSGDKSLWLSLIGICVGSILPSPSPSTLTPTRAVSSEKI